MPYYLTATDPQKANAVSADEPDFELSYPLELSSTSSTGEDALPATHLAGRASVAYSKFTSGTTGYTQQGLPFIVCVNFNPDTPELATAQQRDAMFRDQVARVITSLDWQAELQGRIKFWAIKNGELPSAADNKPGFEDQKKKFHAQLLDQISTNLRVAKVTLSNISLAFTVCYQHNNRLYCFGLSLGETGIVLKQNSEADGPSLTHLSSYSQDTSLSLSLRLESAPDTSSCFLRKLNPGDELFVYGHSDYSLVIQDGSAVGMQLPTGLTSERSLFNEMKASQSLDEHYVYASAIVPTVAQQMLLKDRLIHQICDVDESHEAFPNLLIAWDSLKEESMRKKVLSELMDKQLNADDARYAFCHKLFSLIKQLAEDYESEMMKRGEADPLPPRRLSKVGYQDLQAFLSEETLDGCSGPRYINSVLEFLGIKDLIMHYLVASQMNNFDLLDRKSTEDAFLFRVLQYFQDALAEAVINKVRDENLGSTFLQACQAGYMSYPNVFSQVLYSRSSGMGASEAYKRVMQAMKEMMAEEHQQAAAELKASSISQ